MTDVLGVFAHFTFGAAGVFATRALINTTRAYWPAIKETIDAYTALRRDR